MLTKHSVSSFISHSSHTCSGLVIFICGVLSLTSCGNTPSSPPPGFVVGGGAKIITQYQESGSLPVNIGYVNLTLSYQTSMNFNKYVPGGSDTSYQNLYTGISDATWVNANLRTPAEWVLNWTGLGTHPECQAYIGNDVSELLWPIAFGPIVIYCQAPEAQEQAHILMGDAGGGVTATISPAQINLNSPPSTLNITGSGFLTTYSLPTVLFFDSGGNETAEMDPVNSSQVTATSITVPADLATFVTGKYTFVVSNMSSNGQWYAVAAGTVSAKCLGTCQ